MVERLVQQNACIPQFNNDVKDNFPREKNQVLALATSVSLRNLLSYQDVMKAVEREFHLREGQEREIIMKLWLKEQSMISILQRFRHLFEDLHIDDRDFVEGLKQLREMINYAERDVQNLRDKTVMLENQNRFLENEFQRQLDKIVMDKNEQINRLLQIIEQSCSRANSSDQFVRNETPSSDMEELSRKFSTHNVELQREIGTFHDKLDVILSVINQKLDYQKPGNTGPYSPMVQTALEQMQRTEMKLLELQLKSVSQQEENDLLKYLVEKWQTISDMDQPQLLALTEQRSLEREINRVRQELEITEKKAMQLEQLLANADESLRFYVENLKLKCEVLRDHIVLCTQRLDEISRHNLIVVNHEGQVKRDRVQQEKRNLERKNDELDHELSELRRQHRELTDRSNHLQSDLDNVRKHLLEKEKVESMLNSNVDQQRHRYDQLEDEFRILKAKYEEMCDRIRIATSQAEHFQVILEQTTRRCEQLEKEKLEINVQAESLSQNVAHMTSKYKEKVSSVKIRLEQMEKDKYDLQSRNEHNQHEIECLKQELMHVKEIVYEKDKLIQETQFKNRESLLQKQSIEERMANEYKRLTELVERNNTLEDELERVRRSQFTETHTIRQIEAASDAKHIEELRIKVDEMEQRFTEERTTKDSLQVQIKILEEENADLREIMSQMRRRSQFNQKDEKDRNDEIQQLISRAEQHARQYMASLGLSNLTSTSSVVKLVPLKPSTNVS